MKNFFHAALATLLFCFTGSTVNGQLIINPPQDTSRNRIFVGTGLEPELVATIGYLRVLGRPGKTVDMSMGGSIKSAVLIFTNAWRVNFTTNATWTMRKNWRSIIGSNIYLVHNDDRAGIMNGIGFELRASPGHYGKKWMKGFDLGWQHTAFTHIKHAAAAKDAFNERYPTSHMVEGPIDGWYGATANRFRLGVAGARKISSHWMLQVTVGSMFSIQKQGILLGFSHAQVPVYLESILINF